MKAVTPIYEFEKGYKGNYGPAWVGFSYRSNNIGSYGISWFTREEVDNLVISHSFIVLDQCSVVESTPAGVHKSDLKGYFDDPYCQVFFKKPRNLDYDRMKLIIDRAKSHIGKEYDYGNLMYFLLKLIIHIPIINKRAFFLDTSDEYMCSELVADALLSVKEYSNLYPLSKLHPSKISPMDLFKSEIFKEWRFED
jgi:hypothetical protein